MIEEAGMVVCTRYCNYTNAEHAIKTVSSYFSVHPLHGCVVLSLELFQYYFSHYSLLFEWS